MKKTQVLLIALLCSFFLSAQELEIRLDPKSKPIKIFNKVRFQAVIHNSSDAPIRVFRNSFDEYGGVKKMWTATINGKETKLPGWGLDTNSGYQEGNFIVLEPGESKPIAVKDVELTEAGTYKISYRFNQDPSTVNPKWAETAKARALGSQISKMNLAGQMKFEVAPAEEKPLNLVEISYQELKRKKVFKHIDQAKANPSEVFRFSYTTRNSTNIQADLDAIAQLKNLRGLELQFENNDVRLPAALGKLPLMELKINGFGGKVELPQAFLEEASLRVFSVFNVKMPLPSSLAVHKDLTALAISRFDISAIPAWVGELKELRSLVLDENSIVALPPFMNNLTKLEKVRFNKTQITRLENIFNSSGIKEFEAHQNKLSFIHPDISKLQACTKLRLSYNDLTEIPAEIYQMSNLEDLRLDRNKLQSVPAGIEQFGKLYYLDISNNQVQNFPMGMSNLPKLRYLYARRNPPKKDKEYKSLKRKLSEKGMKFSVD